MLIPVDLKTWDLINDVVLPARPNLALRAYGFYGTTCDLSFVERIPNVRIFYANCMASAVGVEHIASLQNLTELHVGIWNLESFDFLNSIPAGISRLSLGATKSKKPRLHSLARFHSLTRLYLEGQQKGIEIVSQLSNLERFTLRCITTKNVDYLAPLPRLRSLTVKLGGIRDFSTIAGKASLQHLELAMIRGLSDLRFISSLTSLQYLVLQNLRSLVAIPDLSKLTELRGLSLEDLKALLDVSAIFQAPALQYFRHISARNVAPKNYEPLLESPTLKKVHIGFGSRKKNESFARLAVSRGKHVHSGWRVPDEFV